MCRNRDMAKDGRRRTPQGLGAWWRLTQSALTSLPPHVGILCTYLYTLLYLESLYYEHHFLLHTNYLATAGELALGFELCSFQTSLTSVSSVVPQIFHEPSLPLNIIFCITKYSTTSFCLPFESSTTVSFSAFRPFEIPFKLCTDFICTTT